MIKTLQNHIAAGPYFFLSMQMPKPYIDRTIRQAYITSFIASPSSNFPYSHLATSPSFFLVFWFASDPTHLCPRYQLPQDALVRLWVGSGSFLRYTRLAAQLVACSDGTAWGSE